MRLIDADLMQAEETEAFISAQAKITDTVTLLVNEVVHKKIQMLLEDAPTVEIDRPTRSQFKRMAVQLGYEQVVRCQKCAWWKAVIPATRDFGHCEKHRCVTKYDDFCSCGERENDFVDGNKIGERRTNE